MISASKLEEAIECCLHFPDISDDESSDSDGYENHDPVKFVPSEDAHLLKCRRPKQRGVGSGGGAIGGATILGIEENKSLYKNHMMGTSTEVEMVEVTIHKPTMPSSIQHGIVEDGCCCNHPMGYWDRVREGISANGASSRSCGQPCCRHPRLRIVDLTQIQLHRRASSDKANKTIKPVLNGPGNVCHLLRSILTCPGSSSHCASPWSGRYVDSSQRQQPPCRARDEVIAILLLGHHETVASSTVDGIGGEDKSKCNRIERLEISDFVKFRTGDASPSYYLYSISQLIMPLNTDVSGDSSSVDLSALLGPSIIDGRNYCGEGHANALAVTMLVYRHLPPRDILSLTHESEGTIVENSQDPYFLWETYLPPLVKPEESSDAMLVKVEEDEPPPLQYRLVAPPYQSTMDLYPDLFNEIMKPDNIRAIAEEASKAERTVWIQGT